MMEVYEDFGDILCEVYEDVEEPKVYTDGDGCAYCSIKFNVTFTTIPCYEEGDNFELLDSMETKHTHLVKIDDATTFDKESRWVLVELLESMQVPPDQIIIWKIKDCARKMTSAENYNKKGVLGLVVDLDVPKEAAAHKCP